MNTEPVRSEIQAANVENIYGVNISPTAPTLFSVSSSYLVTFIQTYHWSLGRGAQPGTMALQKEDGTILGSGLALGKPGQGGVPNANWKVSPNMVIPDGTYTIADSVPAIWAQNSQYKFIPILEEGEYV